MGFIESTKKKGIGYSKNGFGWIVDVASILYKIENYFFA